jgi:sialate O-acetylesterase
MSRTWSSRLAYVSVIVAALGFAGSAAADVRLPHVISSHMVLQRDVPAAIWGWAEPDEAVSVDLDGKAVATKAGADGKWAVKLAPMPAGGPHKIIVSGKNKIEIEDVLFGEVWICSGQSNMDFGMKSVRNADQEIASAKYPQIRLMWITYKTAPETTDDIEAVWKPCSPETIVTGGFWNGGFSAVAYFFGRDLHKELNVPVGLIHTAWGGTRIEPWTPREGFAPDAQFKDIVKQIDEATPNFNKAIEKTIAGVEAWLPKAKDASKAGKPVPTPPEWPKHVLDNNGQPTGLYNAMIHPFIPYAIRGAIWYQGESNLKDGMLYRDKMKALISGWRTVWGQGEFPFYFVQIAPFTYGEAPDLLPRLWEAQAAALEIPNTGMASITDIGELKDIHPKNKQDVGHRLALCALAKTYGKEGIVYQGPAYKSMAVEGGAVRVKFEGVGGGLASRDGKPLTWFEIAGADKKFVPAEATIDGDSVTVRAEKVAEPVAVRFCWTQTAEPNLMNKEGLPANPFRTDKW